MNGVVEYCDVKKKRRVSYWLLQAKQGYTVNVILTQLLPRAASPALPLPGGLVMTSAVRRQSISIFARVNQLIANVFLSNAKRPFGDLFDMLELYLKQKSNKWKADLN
ncbi:hypothetical protein ECG_06294 [Echinococcus granulosus]|nr:hypothetical protein ECG_06294 [Echinococcus granulosus]